MVYKSAFRKSKVNDLGFWMIGDKAQPFALVIIKRRIGLSLFGDMSGGGKNEVAQKQQAAPLRLLEGKKIIIYFFRQW